MATFAVKADRFFLSGAPVDGGYLVVEDGSFAAHTRERPACEVRDRTGCWIAPGFVDTHIHGSVDRDVMDFEWAGIQDISRAIVRNGVTSWTPTTLTASVDQLAQACATIGEHADDAPDASGARVQGIFLEGPFFTEKYRGAQNPEYFTDPSMDSFELWQDKAEGLISKIAIAPERRGAAEFCSQAVADGVVVALGHSDATYDQAAACVDAGATVFVHTYNAMSGLHHREPGMVGCAMTSDGTFAELICDGHHVNPVACEALVRAKGWDHVVLITDCMRAGGMPDGDYTLGEFPVVVANGTARLKDGGNLAGSILTLDRAVRNVVAWGIVTPEQAIRMASEIPAKANGIDDRCGSIQPGRDADFVVLTPHLEVEATYVAGELAYEGTTGAEA